MGQPAELGPCETELLTLHHPLGQITELLQVPAHPLTLDVLSYFKERVEIVSKMSALDFVLILLLPLPFYIKRSA